MKQQTGFDQRHKCPNLSLFRHARRID